MQKKMIKVAAESILISYMSMMSYIVFMSLFSPYNGLFTGG